MKIFLAVLAMATFPSVLSADHDKPRYQWSSESYVCRDLDRALTEDEFIHFALEWAWDTNRNKWLEDGHTPESWVSEHPECCTAYIRDSVWELEERHTKGLMGWFQVLISSPTITVYVQVPERDRHQSEKWRTMTYLLNRCGLEKDHMG